MANSTLCLVTCRQDMHAWVSDKNEPEDKVDVEVFGSALNPRCTVSTTHRQPIHVGNDHAVVQFPVIGASRARVDGPLLMCLKLPARRRDLVRLGVRRFKLVIFAEACHLINERIHCAKSGDDWVNHRSVASRCSKMGQ